MPVRDTYHYVAKTAIEKDGWSITHDPYRLKLARGKNLFVDLGAERLIAAEREREKIALEIKSFRRISEIRDLEEALGQYILYQTLLDRYDPERELYLAIPEEIRESIFEEEAGAILLEKRLIQLVTFDIIEEEIVSWIR
ncbi:MAG: XisH family protein [Cyanobacteria bacterium SBLK]|nr:XisH family protein [Cyanobacteria bacterium SBLK]